MDDATIDTLITEPKIIVSKPKKELKSEHNHMRDDFELTSIDGARKYKVFIRKNADFQENFSIGLRYFPPESSSLTLFRCNGNHGEVVEDPRKPNEHHFGFHTHTLTAKDLEEGIPEPKLISSAPYGSYEQALAYFCRSVNITDAEQYFGNQLQTSLFE